MLYGHGDDGYQYTKQIIADFSTNVWWGGEPPGLKEHLFSHWTAVNKYPEVAAESLARRIAAHHQLESASVLVTNGTTESIYLIAQAFRKSLTTIVIPTFSEYEDACRMHGHELHFIQETYINEAVELAPGLCFVCNPNNPTGHLYNNLEEIITRHPATLFIVDEAFIEFAQDGISLIPSVHRLQNLIVLRSLTKAFAIPGLRLGYIAAHSILMDKLRLFKIPWTVNTWAIEAGHFIFSQYDQEQVPLGRLRLDKAAFLTQLQATSLEVKPSSTHFFLARLTSGTASGLKQFLIDEYGILIRNASNFRGLTEMHIRLATLAPFNNNKLVNALQQWEKRS